MENKETILVDGLYIDKPSEKAPEFVKMKMSAGQKFIEFYENNKNEKGYINFDILEAKSGKLYAKLNVWTKKDSQTSPEAQNSPKVDISEPEVSDIPF